MKVWKLVSGVLSILASVAIFLQSFAAGIINTLSANGESSGTAGLVVAAMLLTGVITSIATGESNRKGGDVAIIILYIIATFYGISMAGNYTDLYIWCTWCIICGILAFVDIQHSEPTKGSDPHDNNQSLSTKFCPVCGMELPMEAVCCWRCGYKPESNN